MRRPHKAKKSALQSHIALLIIENTVKFKEGIRKMRIPSIFVALCFEQTSPLGVPSYAFGEPKTRCHLVFAQFVQSVLFSVQPKKGL